MIRFVFSVFRTSLQQRMRRLKNWLILLLIPCLVLTVRLALPEEQVTAPVQVGVALPDTGAEALWTLLEQRSGTVLRFVEADADVIDSNIAAGRWDCGVIVADDFSERLTSLDTQRIFTIRVGAGSTVYPLVEETLAACMAELVTGPIAADYLTRSGILSAEDAASRQIAQHLGTEDRVIIHMATADGTPIEPFQLGSSGVTRILSWVISAAVFVWLLLAAYDLGLWIRADGAKRLIALRSEAAAMLARMAADWLVITVAGCGGMLLLGCGPRGCAALIVYGLFWAIAGVFAAKLPSLWQAIPIFPPFAVVLSLLFSGALVDISSVLPVLSRVLLLLPGNLFLQVCRGETGALLPLAMGTVIFLILAALPGIQKKAKN